MEILSFKTIHGPNVYHHNPVIIMKLDLKKWANIGSHQIPDFQDRLLELLPGLQDHECSPGHPGGFVERLKRGTYMAHIAEHVALELSRLTDIEVGFGKARAAGQEGHYHVITRFVSEEGMKECLRSAVQIVESCLNQKTVLLFDILQRIRHIISENKLGPTTQALVDVAKKRKIPFKRLDQFNSLMQLGYGKNKRFLQASMSDRTPVIATDLVQDKDSTKAFLSRYGIPSPLGRVVTNLEELRQALLDLKPPYVVKPLDGHHGKGVALNIKDIHEAENAFHMAQSDSKSSAVLVEEMCLGQDYRVLVVNGEFVAAALRKPPQVVGDGQSTLEELIEIENQNPLRGHGHESVLSKIQIDDLVREHLHKQAKDLTSVPKSGQVVSLRGAANISSGGTAQDVTALAHPEVKLICERIARLVNLDICGIDIIHTDIAKPVHENFNVIEVNAAPGLRMHLAPTEGSPQPVAEKIMDMLYPKSEDSRIPIISVTGTNGKTTVVRLLKKILSAKGKTVGLTTTDGIWIGNDKIVSGDTTGPFSTETILADPLVDVAVLEVARGGLLRGGLGYDWSDVSVITNIRPDHLGQDGLEDLEDIVWVKSLVAERVHENGTLVLNADDPAALSLKDNSRLHTKTENIMLYSMNPESSVFQEHLQQQGKACWTDGEWIYVKNEDMISTVIQLSDIPITLGGSIDYQISNVLAAVAGSVALGADLTQVREGLRNFSLQDNQGRFSLYQIQDGYVVLDYAHNPDAISSLGKTLRSWKDYQISCVVGLPGDRADHLIQQSAIALGSYFDRLILRDDEDLRGRKSGEVPFLIEQEIRKFRPQAMIETILDGQQALTTAVSRIKKGQILVVLFEDLEATLETLKPFKPSPVTDLPIFELETAAHQNQTGIGWNNSLQFLETN